LFIGIPIRALKPVCTFCTLLRSGVPTIAHPWFLRAPKASGERLAAGIVIVN
jgi:hypothetical protein